MYSFIIISSISISIIIVVVVVVVVIIIIIIQALELAKEASRKERMLCKQREQKLLAEQINLDLTYSVS